MKKLFTILTALFISVSFLANQVHAQAPAKLSYQAVVRNAVGGLVINQAVGIRVSILQTSASGTAVYVETQTPNTNSNGLVSIQIGGGAVVSGSISSIDWSAGPYFIKTETDPSGGTTYTITGTNELLSVPYSMYAANGNWTKNGNDISNANSGNVGIGTVTPSTAKLVISGISGDEGLDLSSTDQYANLRVLHNSLGTADNDMFIGYGSGATSTLRLYSDNNETVTITGGNVGIGTTTPAARLDISGNIKISDGTEGAGKVLTSDASGTATWQPGPVRANLFANIYNSPAFVMADGQSYTADFGSVNFIENLTYSNGIITVPADGVYHFELYVATCYMYTNSINMQILTNINGGLFDQTYSNALSMDLKLTAGSQVSFTLIQNSGSSQTLCAFSRISCFKAN